MLGAGWVAVAVCGETLHLALRSRQSNADIAALCSKACNTGSWVTQNKQNMLQVEGLPTIALGLWMRTALVESPAKAHFLTLEEREWVQARVARSWVSSWPSCLLTGLTQRLTTQMGTSADAVKLQSILHCTLSGS